MRLLLSATVHMPDVVAGPNEISVIDISVMHQILGQDGMPRGPSTLLIFQF